MDACLCIRRQDDETRRLHILPSCSILYLSILCERCYVELLCFYILLYIFRSFYSFYLLGTDKVQVERDD